jgi:hypothetical protein
MASETGMTSRGSSPSVKPQSWFKRWRASLIALLIIAGCVAVWFGWDYWQAIQDERALKEYLAELDQREPNWRERVYGKEATAEQAESRRKLNVLAKALPTSNPAWIPYREGLYQGMYNDPAHPAARLPEEQVAFLNWARGYWKPFREKLEVVDTLMPLNRNLLRDESYEKMIAPLQQGISNLWLVNEPIELETIYHINKNDPQEALKWLRRSLHLQLIRHKLTNLHQLDSIPFFVERLLDLSEPNQESLTLLQRDLEAACQLLETEPYLQFGSECRLQEKTIREIVRGELKYPQLDRIGAFHYLIPNDSTWNAPWLQFARTHYLQFLVRNMYHRPDHVALKVHHLADHIEDLAKLPQDQRWPKWKDFADASGLSTVADYFHADQMKPPKTESIPDGVYYLNPYTSAEIVALLNREIQMKTALIAVAAERYRLDHGRFPKSWSELVPSYLVQEIIDPFTRMPLIIKNHDKGIVIYSIGRDGKDEGGENLSWLHYWHYGAQRFDWTKTNIGTRVYLPQFRRDAPIQLDESQKKELNKWKEFEAEQKKKAEQGNK